MRTCVAVVHQKFSSVDGYERLVVTMACIEPMVLGPDQHLTSILKEHRTRRQNGLLLAYILEDKRLQQLVIGQKLSLLAQYINEHVVSDKPDQVSPSGLWQIISAVGGRTGGYTKHRWRVVPVMLSEAAIIYENLRKQGFEKCVVVGNPRCYRVAGG